MAAVDDNDRPLLLDELSEKLDQFRLFRDSDQTASDRILDELGGQGKVENDMIAELSAQQPFAHPERFYEAHVLTMHAIEVLQRNGTRPPSGLKLGVLNAPASFLVQQVTRLIVRSHQSHVVSAIDGLYTRRLAWTPLGDPNRVTLVRARLDVERASPAYKKGSGGLPTFLVGGAAVSTLATGSQKLASTAAGSRVGIEVAIVATFILLAAASWVILRGAAIARRRIRLTIDKPVNALWETVGRCGNPPRDQARTFALIGIGMTALGWVLIPLGVLLFAVL